ncbi:MAG: NAD(P)-dependent oxidoreductase [Candidatus Tectomicrobia bacterium]|nr:NAD(P)-dependent oxidoreductase [Candidatus Tectomicrobia bacterium]
MAGVLITGGTGLIGAQVARLLVERGESPLLFELSPRQEAVSALQAESAGAAARGRIHLLQGDVLHLDQVRAAVRQHDIRCVIHTAALRGLTAGVQANPYEGARLNFEGALNILEAARLEGVRRVVFSSSSTVYFGTLDPLPATLREEMPLRPPPSIYAATKLAAEHLGRNYARWFGVEFTAVRYARVIGPQANPVTPHGVALKTMAEAAVRGEPAKVEAFLFSEELLSYRDAARGTVLAALKKGDPAPAYNIGSGQPHTMAEVLEALRRCVPEARISTRPLSPSFPYRFPIPPQDGELAQRDLGYTAACDLEQIMAEYCDYARARRG